MATIPPGTMPWFAITYSHDVRPGLPPYFQASRICTYADHDDTWIIALWEFPPELHKPANCILRLPASAVQALTRHTTLTDAARHHRTLTPREHSKLNLSANPIRPTTQEDTPPFRVELRAGSDLIHSWVEPDISTFTAALLDPSRKDSIALGDQTYLSHHTDSGDIEVLIWRDGRANPTDVFRVSEVVYRNAVHQLTNITT